VNVTKTSLQCKILTYLNKGYNFKEEEEVVYMKFSCVSKMKHNSIDLLLKSVSTICFKTKISQFLFLDKFRLMTLLKTAKIPDVKILSEKKRLVLRNILHMLLPYYPLLHRNYRISKTGRKQFLNIKHTQQQHIISKTPPILYKLYY